jgi:hypothetical protein
VMRFGINAARIRPCCRCEVVSQLVVQHRMLERSSDAALRENKKPKQNRQGRTQKSQRKCGHHGLAPSPEEKCPKSYGPHRSYTGENRREESHRSRQRWCLPHASCQHNEQNSKPYKKPLKRVQHMNRPAGDVFFVQPRHVCLHCLETKSKLSGKLDGPSSDVWGATPAMVKIFAALKSESFGIAGNERGHQLRRLSARRCFDFAGS